MRIQGSRLQSVRWQRVCRIFVLALVTPALLGARAQRADLTELSLEELMGLEVTSVSKKEEELATVAEAVYVLTGEEIIRSGFTSIPEALRLVPGVQVARVDSNTWAIGIRGFASSLARSVLVLIDGRTVYNPLFAGTYWELQDVYLEDIDRIEVTRGPGGSLWGANAFNGVINIITKSAAETQGMRAMARAGTEEYAGAARYGGAIGENLHYRAYGKYFDRDGGYPGPSSEYDDWWMARGGFRLDWQPGSEDLLTLQGDIYDGELGSQLTVAQFTPPFRTQLKGDADASGGNVLGRWNRVLSRTSDLALQLYYDHTFRRDLHFREERDTFDIDWQHRFAPWRNTETVWGLQYRVTTDDTGGVTGIGFDPTHSTDNLVTAFVQNEIVLIQELLHLTVGSKFEHNDYSGFEVQPNVRLLLTPLADHSFWASFGRSVRTPSRTEDDLFLTVPPVNLDPTNANQCLPPGMPCVFPQIVGNRDFDSEKLLAAQLGHRMRVLPRLFVDSVVFYHHYDDLLSVEPGTPFPQASPPPEHVILPLSIHNKLHGESYGLEIAADAFVTDSWILRSGYSFLQMDLERGNGSADAATAGNTQESSPQNQFFLHSELDLPWNVSLDGNLRYVDNLPAQSTSSYVTFDVRAAWAITPQVEVSVVGQNLADGHHREFAGGTQVERSVYGQVRFQW